MMGHCPRRCIDLDGDDIGSDEATSIDTRTEAIVQRGTGMDSLTKTGKWSWFAHRLPAIIWNVQLWSCWIHYGADHVYLIESGATEDLMEYSTIPPIISSIPAPDGELEDDGIKGLYQLCRLSPV